MVDLISNCDKTKPIFRDKTGQKGTLGIQLSLSSSGRKHLAHFLPALPAVSHTVSSDFPEEHSEAGQLTCRKQGDDAARVRGSIPCAAL